jgi:hypothetical protein
MARIAENMEIAEGNLQKKEAGKPTQEAQQKIIDDLDKLIKQQNDQNQGGSGQSSSSSSQDSSSSGNSQKNQPNSKPMGDPEPKPDKGQKNNPQPKNNPSNQPNKANDPKTVEGNKIGINTNPPANKNNDDIANFWGDLPKAPRTQANTVGKHASMNEDYRKLLEFYRSATAAKK